MKTLLTLASFLVASGACATETCQYSGTTSYSGRVMVETIASSNNGEVTVNVTARLNAKSLLVFNVAYLHQEISVWRDGELRSVAVNHRYTLNGSIRRQNWDVFTRGPTGMTAYRAQAKTLTDFQDKHPGFVNHWALAAFGQPWLRDYPMAAPERRPDLDLPKAALAPGIGPPLAMAFYWMRWAAPGSAPVFLPGFKQNPRIDVPVVLEGTDGAGTRHFRSVTRHPQLGDAPPSVGEAFVAADHQLRRIVFEAHGSRGKADGDLRLERCQGAL